MDQFIGEIYLRTNRRLQNVHTAGLSEESGADVSLKRYNTEIFKSYGSPRVVVNDLD